ncbi:hypothetical protein SOP91_00180 (plasmid) [Enterobacter hormaechei]|uniref:hypothetical protein n=1 Tax=Enterobacter hormaechei TaxID=158836 RepID=UPI002B4BF72B|nr:hypothetical protein [Enterobacter hormaechei]WRM07127.1 hypothetical protein SOP91_00180 [Enterobacter hormaechei]
MHTPERYVEVFQEGRLAGEIGVRREHNPFLGTDLADAWEEGRQHGEQNFELFKRDLDDHFADTTGHLAMVVVTVIFLIVITVVFFLMEH